MHQSPRFTSLGARSLTIVFDSGRPLFSGVQNRTALPRLASLGATSRTSLTRDVSIAQAQSELSPLRLETMATRIKARAIKRMGELFEEIEKGQPGPKPELGGCVSTQLPSRKEAAEHAGISRDQRIQAQRVARVPRDEYERQQ
jgi:hypothetical protein